MKRNGQALVEFIIILPIFIFMLLGIIDIGKIIHNQNILENQINDIITLYKNEGNTTSLDEFIERNNKDAILDINQNEEFIEFVLSKRINITTPGLNIILDNPFKITVKRVIYDE